MVGKVSEQLVIEAIVKDLLTKEMRRMGGEAEKFGKKTNRSLAKVQLSLKGVAKAARTAGRALKGLVALGGLGGLAASFFGVRGIVSATRSAAAFSEAMAEVSTIVDTTAVSVDSLREGVLNIAKAQGQLETTVAKGLYQAISAGAEAGAESLGLLETASRLAIAGVATTSESVDVLTTAINAYGRATGDAAEISDQLFLAVEQGKTTISELAGSLGDVIPIAAQLGVQIDDLLVLVAALTKGGTSTSEAGTQLKGVFSGLLRPTGAVADGLRKVGIEIDKDRIATEGFITVLDQLAAANRRDPAAVLQIFGGQRQALSGVLALTGNLRAEVDSIGVAMENAGGKVEQAFIKQMQDPAKKAQAILNNLRIEFLSVGNAAIIGFNEAVERAGGLEGVIGAITPVVTLVSEKVGDLIASLGDGIKTVNEFWEAFGGAEAATDTVLEVFDVIEAGLKTIGTLAKNIALALADVARGLILFKNPLEAVFGTREQFDAKKALEQDLRDLKEVQLASGRAGQERIFALREEFAEALRLPGLSSAEIAEISGSYEAAIKIAGDAHLASVAKVKQAVRDLQAEIASAPEGSIDLFDRAGKSIDALFSDASATADAFGVLMDNTAKRIQAALDPEAIKLQQWHDFLVSVRREALSAREALGEGIRSGAFVDALERAGLEFLDYARTADKAETSVGDLVQSLLDLSGVTRGIDLVKLFTGLDVDASALARDVFGTGFGLALKEADVGPLVQLDPAALQAFDEAGNSVLRTNREILRLEKELAVDVEDRVVAAQRLADIDQMLARERLQAIGAEQSEVQELLGLLSRKSALEIDGLRIAAERARFAEQEKAAAESLASAREAVALAERGAVVAAIDKEFDRVTALTEAWLKLGFTQQEVAEMARTELVQAFEGTEASIRGLKAATDDWVDASRDDFSEAAMIATRSLDTLRDSMGDAIFEFVSGSKSASEAFKDFARTVVSEIGRMVARSLAADVVGGLGSFFGFGTLGGSSGAGAGATSGGGNPLGSFLTPIPGGDFAAGGIANSGGGWSPISRGMVGALSSRGASMNAIGGIVSGPHVNVAGEGSMREAIIPIPNGRSVQAEITDSGGGGVTVINNINVTAMDTRGVVDALSGEEVQRFLHNSTAGAIATGSNRNLSQAVRSVK